MKMTMVAMIAASMTSASNVEAAAIVYTGNQQIKDVDATYSITTDGTTGTLTAANVTDYTITLLRDGAVNTLNRHNSGLHATFSATTSSLSVSGTQELQFNNAFAPSASTGGTTTVGYTDFLLIYDTGTQVGFKFTADGSTGTTTFSSINNTTGFASSLSTVTPVPEPVTWAMMLLGFGMVGGAVRYRRRVTGIIFA